MYSGLDDGDFGGLTIKGLQQFLASLGYEEGGIDGSWGVTTAKAFQTFLKDKAFYDGAIDGLVFEGNGQSITACQKWLASVGQDPGPADGKWGGVTITALQRFLKAWDPDALCDGVRAEERMQWLVDNQGMSVDAAKGKVKNEFPGACRAAWNPDALCDGVRAEERMQWLVDNQGMSVDDAKGKVKSEFPGVSGAASTDYVDCKFPHTMSVVDGKLKFAVTPRNPSEVSMVAVHYQIDDGKSMNFDIKSPEPGTNTYVHVTPGSGPTCPPGSKVSYWLCANVKGLLQEEPQGACPHPDRRLYWTAR